MIWITTDNIQRVVIPKAGDSELWFLCFANCNIVNVHLPKVSRNYLEQFSSYRVDTNNYKNHYFHSSKGHNSKSLLTRVIVLVFCNLPHNALHLCEVSSKYLEWYLTYRREHSRRGYFQYLLCPKGRNSKNRLTRVMVFVFCMLSSGAIFCETFHQNI